jgi:hypothetical protein
MLRIPLSSYLLIIVTRIALVLAFTISPSVSFIKDLGIIRSVIFTK